MVTAFNQKHTLSKSHPSLLFSAIPCYSMVSGFVSREDLVHLCNEMGLSNITPGDWEILYEKFDIESNSRVSIQ